MHRSHAPLVALALALALAARVDVRPADAAGLTVQSPAPGAEIQGATVTIRFQVSDFRIVPSTIPLAEAGKRPEANRPGEGHLHFMLDLEPLVVWDRADPYTFRDVPAGAHRLMIEVANNDHSSLSPPVSQVIQFRVAPTMPGSGAGGAASAAPAEWPLGPAALLAGGAALVAGAEWRRRRRRS